MKYLTDFATDAVLRSALFAGAEPAAARTLLRAMGAREERFADGETILRQGERNDSVYIVAAGGAVGEHIGADGRAVIVNEMAAGDVFGDVLSGSSVRSPVEVAARGETRVVAFPLSGMFSPCAECRGAQEALLRNLIAAISDKYFALSRRVELLLKGTLRARIAAYLAAYDSGDWFRIPHTREEQSRYLGSDRSALSRELSNMRRDGLIEYRKDRFRVLRPDALRALAQ
ncbi:MAG: Crp/Fnr family transcriptional regulator [Oscillospiraceae bacterium]|nr:Crp/Fnr family transcriptional regulator [Oscillospiraceae bacterium]